MTGSRSLRARLTLWYTAALAALLAVLGAASYLLLDRGLRDNVDASLESVAGVIARSSREDAAASNLDATLEALLGPALAGRLFELLDPRGRPDPRLSPRARDRLPLSPAALRNAEVGRETFETVRLPGPAGGLVRVLTSPVVRDGRIEQLVQVGMSLDPVDEARRRFLLVLAGLAPLALAGAAGGGWWLAGRALAPVDAMVETARRITAEDLARRIDAPATDDELGRLAGVLNDMLARLEHAFAAARRFSADAAHELRTPLTILKGEIEVALASPPDAAESRRVLASAQEEVDRLVALVEDLLFLARVDAGVTALPDETVDLGAVVADAAPALGALAERAGIALRLPAAGTAVPVRGSAPLLLRVVVNLVENALRYTPPGGHVAVDVGARGGAATLAVRDDGPGIPADAQARVFERFWRGDPARGRGGTGLGLALVRSIVTLHGGEVTVDSTPGAGSTFRVTLPLA